jgi:hypothetical protein
MNPISIAKGITDGIVWLMDKSVEEQRDKVRALLGCRHVVACSETITGPLYYVRWAAENKGCAFEFAGLWFGHHYPGFDCKRVSANSHRWNAREGVVQSGSNYSGLIRRCPICAVADAESAGTAPG